MDLLHTPYCLVFCGDMIPCVDANNTPGAVAASSVAAPEVSQQICEIFTEQSHYKEIEYATQIRPLMRWKHLGGH